MLVSIIIPMYNASLFIEDTINSCLNQSYQSFEIIIMDDGSIDNSAELVSKISDDRVKYFYKPNSGVSDTRNKGIEFSSGEYLAFLDADDIWYKDKLEIQLSELERTDLNWCISNCDTINEKNAIISKSISKRPNSNNHFEELITWNTNSFVGVMSSLIVKKDFCNDIKFKESISSPADRDFVIKLARKSNALYIDKSLWQYRILSNSMSKNEIKVIEDMLKQYEDYEDSFYGDLKLKNKSLKRLYYIVYRTYLKKGRITKAVNYFLKYLLINL
jgi:glycosyltransferase involved in cell wall biosynthesis